jgi:hypothetical protein
MNMVIAYRLQTSLRGSRWVVEIDCGIRRGREVETRVFPFPSSKYFLGFGQGN